MKPLICVSLLLFVQAEARQSADGFYLGTLTSAGQTIDIGMTLAADQSGLTGTYFYFGKEETIGVSPRSRYPLAWTLAALGDIESALDQYELSVGEREPFLMFPLFPGNDPLRGHPRFAAALQRMGLGWAARA